MILIALGANLPSPVGEPAVTLRAALAALGTHDAKVDQVSPFYSSVAWPNPSDPEFVNAVAALRTELEPAALLACLQAIEQAFGRTAKLRNAPRPLDLDIIDYDGRIEMGPPQLPHPRLSARGFVLFPLKDIAPGWRHPVSGESVEQLIARLPGGEAAKPVLR